MSQEGGYDKENQTGSNHAALISTSRLFISLIVILFHNLYFLESLLHLISYKYIFKKIKYKYNHETTFLNFDHVVGARRM